MPNSGGQASTTHRVHSLDGLRGVAAAVVLVHHSLLLIPAFVRAPVEDKNSLAWWMVHTPLHTLWEGKGAVYVFFVLSGLVLTLPALKPGFSWISYFPSRLIRLYIPVWAAVTFSAGLIFFIPRTDTVASEWLQGRATDVTLPALMKDLVLLLGSGNLDSPLWSLKWEVIFSLVLPAYVWVIGRYSKRSVVKFLVCLVLVALTATEKGWLTFLPMFFAGSLMASEQHRLVAYGQRIEAARFPFASWLSLLGAALVLLNSYWLLMPLHLPQAVQEGLIAAMLIGAVIIVFVAWQWTSLKAFLNLPAIQWLGMISFSLYLIHEPVVVTLGYLLGGSHTTLAIPASIIIAPALAFAFHRLVERPSHRLATRVRSNLTKNRPAKDSLLGRPAK